MVNSIWKLRTLFVVVLWTECLDNSWVSYMLLIFKFIYTVYLMNLDGYVWWETEAVALR